MTNREWLASLSNEELASSFYFCECPRGELNRAIEREKQGIYCDRDKLIYKDKSEWTVEKYRRCSDACKQCKAKWLGQEHQE